MNAFIESKLMQVVGWSLIHFVWQGLLVAWVTWLVLNLFARQTSNIRYVVGCLGLSAMLLCPLVTSTWLASTLTPGTTPTSFNLDQGKTPSSNQEMAHANLAVELKRESVPAKVDVNGKESVAVAFAEVATNTQSGASELSLNPGTEVRALSSASATLDRVGFLVGQAIPVFILIWSAGVCLLSFKLLVGWFRVRGLQQIGDPVQDQAVVATFEDIKSRMGVRIGVSLRETVAVCSPVLIGWLRPVVLLPLVATTGLNQRELAAVLAHELAHIRRADYLVNLLQAVIETLLFYHPAVWWVSRRIREERENCCDDLAISVCDDRRTLAQALLKLEQARPATGGSLVLASTGADLVKRVARLLEPDHPGARQRFAPFTNWVAAAMAFGLVAILFAVSLANNLVAANQTSGTPSDVLQDADKNEQNQDSKSEQVPEKIRVRVIDPDGNPISGARLLLGIWYGETANTLRFVTNEDGFASLPFPDDLRIFRLWAYADGYAGLVATWEEDDIKQGVLPADGFTFQMIRSVAIGGVFVDDAGNPVENVAIEVQYQGGGEIAKGRIRFNSSCALSSRATPTDLRSKADGRWSLGNIPPGDNVKLQLRVTHPEYISDERWGELQGVHQIGLKDLRDQTAKIVLKEGISIRGTVSDEAGNPIPQALIVWGDSPYGQEGSQEMFVESDGSFRVPSQRPGNLRVTVIAKGYAPETRILSVSSDMPEEDFILEPGKKLEIQFVDQDGKPATDVFVGIEDWRGVQSLYNHVHPNVKPTGIPNRSDDNGVYVWDWAPEDVVTYQFSSRGFQSQRGVRLTAQDRPITVKLKRPARFSGTVTDLDGQPIENFSVIPLRQFNEESYTENRQDLVQGKDGTFSLGLDIQEGKYRLKIEAEGFLDAVTELFDHEETRTFEIRLEPSKPIQYQVVNDNGTPVSNCRIVVAPIDQVISLTGYTEFELKRTQSLTTDENGFFVLQPSKVARTIMAISADGYGEVGDKPEAPATTINLTKWATVQGTVTRNGQPWQATRRVTPIRYLSGKSYHLQQYSFENADGGGNFEVSRIAAVPTTIVFTGNDQARSTFYNLAISPRPDEAIQIDFSQATRFSTRIRFEGANRDKVDLAKSIVTLRALEPSVQIPPDLQAEIEASGLSSKDPRAIIDWFTDRENWDAARSFGECFDTYYGRISEDGSFSMDLYRPGKYEVSIQPTGKSTSQVSVQSWLADHRIVAQVGPEPIDVGEIVVPLFEDPKVGSEVDDFEFKNLNEQTKMSLTKFRGRYVLLDFWSPWCDACKNDTAKVHRLATMLAADKTAIISLMANGSGPTVRMPTKIPAGLTWIDGQVSLRNERHLWRSLGVWTSQHFVLVDPDGNYVVGGTLVQVAAKMEELGLK